jgi:nitroimidazol reductase NimA-like FMN-containing flavoprotein (pyridoxamine 5'-phosphate oxidase superfamily)
LTTAYESAIAFGSAELVEDVEKRVAIYELVKKYSPQLVEKYKINVPVDGNGEEEECKNTKVIKIVLEHVTGKSRVE